MMIREFIDRTGYKAEYPEYHYIEESYYEFDGGKDEFCQQWLKDKKSGKWDMELRFRKALDEQKAKYEAILAEKEEYLDFYRPYYDEANELGKELATMKEKFTRLTRIIERASKILED